MSSEDREALRPYLAILAAALVIGTVLLLYVAGSWDQIRAILTQSPT
jgi:hypothetical protein